MSQYILSQIFSRISEMMNRGGIATGNPVLYNEVISNLQAPGSPVQNSLINILNQRTNGQWQNGAITDTILIPILRDWLNDVMPKIDYQIQQAQRAPQQTMGYAPQQQFGGYRQAVAPQYTNPSGSMYEGVNHYTPPAAPLPQAQPVQQTSTAAWMPEVDFNKFTPSEKDARNMDQDPNRPITVRLTASSMMMHDLKKNGVVSVDHYCEGEFDGHRISTIDIKLHTPENLAIVAADKALTHAPNEVIRGLYANSLEFQELHHVPMKTSEFHKIAQRIGSIFYTEKGIGDWRAAWQAIGELTRHEHKVLESAILHFLNPSIVKFFRTNEGAVIEGIEELDDLNELDNPRTKLAVPHHPRYPNVFNEVITRAFDAVLNPKHMIHANDQNFGDFIHCNKIDFWHDGRSKYDYGTFVEKADRLRFIDMMMEQHTVLRVKKMAIITNALDEKLVNALRYAAAKDMIVLHTTNQIGCQLLLKLDQPRQTEIDAIICIEKETGSVIGSHTINLGRTLNGDLVLIR